MSVRDLEMYDPSPADPIGMVAPFLQEKPTWVFLGGLGNGDEVHWALRRWPSCKIIGVDLDPRALWYQSNHDWPSNHPLIHQALSDKVGYIEVNYDEINCASAHPSMLAIAKETEYVEATTVDTLEGRYGPFEKCLLWLDLEGYDYKALAGSRRLLESGRVLLVNVETRYEHGAENSLLRQLLEEVGFVQVWVWFRQWWGHNEVWLPKERR